MTTGEKIDGATGIVINVNGETSADGCLAVHAGDLLRLSFTPPEEYSVFLWEATSTQKGIVSVEKYTGNPAEVANLSLSGSVTNKLNKLNKLKSIIPEAYYYWVKISEML